MAALALQGATIVIRQSLGELRVADRGRPARFPQARSHTISSALGA
jgi:hypothetical protein